MSERTRIDVDSQRNDTPQEGAELEDGPEDAKGLPLVLLQWVTHHDRTLEPKITFRSLHENCYNVPCADQSRAAVMPRIPPDKIKNQRVPWV